MANLSELIDAFAKASTAYRAAEANNLDAKAEDFPEWEAYEAAEHAVIIYPCRSLEDVRTKARFFLDNDGPYDTIRNCVLGEEETLLLFLRSLVGGASCD